MNVVIYPNPDRGTSRKTSALIVHAGIKPDNLTNLCHGHVVDANGRRMQ